MKLFHLSDLHLGKRVNEFSMIEDQRYILTRILNMIDEEKPEGVILAGDIYDKSVPSAEAVELCDDFLVRLAKRGLEVFIISGNHDSPERLAFGSRLMDASGIHIAPVYHGEVKPLSLEDEFGRVNFWLLPFVKPVHVRRFFPEEEISTYSQALDAAIRHMELDPAGRNVLVTHQFVTGAERSDSEDISVGGADNVDASVFEPFDYVALGHLHGPQNVGSERIRYCGTPLKYSFSEAAHEKSVTVVELGAKGGLTVRELPLNPVRDMKEIRGTYEEVMHSSFGECACLREDYLHVTLTDEEDVPDAVMKLRLVYPNLMKLDYDNRRTRSNYVIEAAEDVERRSPLDLFDDLYEKQNGARMSELQRGFAGGLIEKIWEDEQ